MFCPCLNSRPDCLLEVAVATLKQEDGRETWPENLRTRLNYPA
jgi:hypothetical protein